MNAQELEKLLADVTPGPWWTDAKYKEDELGCAVIAARTDCGPLPGNPTRGMVAWASEILKEEASRCEANARLIALAPTLARRVIAAEKMAEALQWIKKNRSLCNIPSHDGEWDDHLKSALAEWESAQ